MAECYFTFDRLPNYQLSPRTLMEVTNRLRGSKPRIRIMTAGRLVMDLLRSTEHPEKDTR
jgi:hypothetical protein